VSSKTLAGASRGRPRIRAGIGFLAQSRSNKISASGVASFARLGAKLDAMKATIDQVEKHPTEYLERVLEGETVVLVQNDRPVAEIRPLNAALGPRPIGLAAGDFVVPDDFDAPLPDDLLDAFEGK
jgi:antitoxin (DNA-binding transcriptional repressor) of toxin-antitoxin stability system